MCPFNIHDQWLGDVMPQSGVDVAFGRNTADGHMPGVPVTEFHSQQSILHDTNGSGVTVYNANDLRLEVIPTTSAPSGAQPIVTAVLFEAYDNTGNRSCVGTTNTTVRIDQERINTHPEIFVLSNDELQINMAGTYKFRFHFTADTTGTTRSTQRLELQRQPPGGSFTLVGGSRCSQMTRNQTVTHTAINSVVLDDVVVGEKFRLQTRQISSVLNTFALADQCGLLVRKLA